nr:MAG TPA: hypothetical protein [Caudoviricetes sp.]
MKKLNYIEMKDLLKHQMDYILLDFILWYHLYKNKRGHLPSFISIYQ